jgi:hypothetical protein
MWCRDNIHDLVLALAFLPSSTDCKNNVKLTVPFHHITNEKIEFSKTAR